MNITLTKISDDKLTKEQWNFYFNSEMSGICRFSLSSYALLEKEQAKVNQVWRVKKVYDSHRRHSNNVTQSDVITDEIIKEAIELILKKIRKEIKFQH